MTYNKKTGVTSVISFAKLLCRIYTKFGGTITQWVQNSSLTGEQKAALLAWLGLASTMCALMETIGDD